MTSGWPPFAQPPAESNCHIKMLGAVVNGVFNERGILRAPQRACGASTSSAGHYPQGRQRLAAGTPGAEQRWSPQLGGWRDGRLFVVERTHRPEAIGVSSATACPRPRSKALRGRDVGQTRDMPVRCTQEVQRRTAAPGWTGVGAGQGGDAPYRNRSGRVDGRSGHAAG